MSDDTTGMVTIMQPSALQAQVTAEYDVAIATAHKFPRSLDRFFKKAESMVTVTPEVATSCEYAKPVGGGKVTGPSARLAEIVAATYGNLRVQARIISETATEIVAQGVAHDLESNVAHSTEIAVSIVKKDGTRYGADQVATMRAAACAKARRNAIFLVVPAALCQPIIAKARAVAAGDAKTLPERRANMLAWFEKQGVKRASVFVWLGVSGESDIGLEQMADLIAAANTAKEEGTLSAVFSAPRSNTAIYADDEDPTRGAK